MNLTSKLILSCVAIGGLALSPAQVDAAGRGSAAAGAGAHFNNAMARVSAAGGARPVMSRNAPSANAGRFAGRQWNGNGSGHWSGNGNGHWRDGNHNWHHRGRYYPRYYGYYPYWDYGFGYPYYGLSTSLYYDGYGYGDNGYGYERNRSGNLVAGVQQRLARAGYYRGEIDGVIGSGTRRAIRSYERSHGLPVDGRIDGELLGRLGLS
ncbi:MAG: peptidoglycan-binding protein [Verrucomicrobiota bacterium]|nr:peptidoglycan-binding protein [Verrucomicrobiota bacterium]